jgi:hypothetical protein
MATVLGYLLRIEWSILSRSCLPDECPERGAVELALTADNEKEDNSRRESLLKTKLLLLGLGFFAFEFACLGQGSKPGQNAPSPGPAPSAPGPTKYLNRDSWPFDVAKNFPCKSFLPQPRAGFSRPSTGSHGKVKGHVIQSE